MALTLPYVNKNNNLYSYNSLPLKHLKIFFKKIMGVNEL